MSNRTDRPWWVSPLPILLLLLCLFGGCDSGGAGEGTDSLLSGRYLSGELAGLDSSSLGGPRSPVGPGSGTPTEFGGGGDQSEFIEIVSRASASLGGALSNGPRTIASTLSADGRFVAFSSNATNLVPGVGDGTQTLVYVYDRQSQTIEVAPTLSVSLPASAVPNYGHPAISADGRYVAFVGAFTIDNVPVPGYPHRIYLYDRQEQVVHPVPDQGLYSNAIDTLPSISADGRYLAFEAYSPDADGIAALVYDHTSGTVELVSRVGGPTGIPVPGRLPVVSPDGRFVGFSSDTSDIVPGVGDGVVSQVYVYDRLTQGVEHVSKQNGPAGAPASSPTFNAPFSHLAFSADGRYLAFSSFATNLAPGVDGEYHHVYVYDRSAQTVELASRQSGADGPLIVGSSFVTGSALYPVPSISADGRYVVFSAASLDLTERGFVRDRESQTTAPLPRTGTVGGGYKISQDGRVITYWGPNPEVAPAPQVYVTNNPL